MARTERLDPERWRRAVTLFERMLELDPTEREGVLAEVDPTLRLTVLRMLESDRSGASLLDEGLEGVAEITLAGGPSEPPHQAGDRVGDFEVLGLLGRGGMGIVYEARDLRLGRLAALKLLSRARGDPGSAGRLFAEARAASALDHPNIATVYQVGETGTRPFIAMARYEGQTLGERLQAGPLSGPEALDIGVQVARALSVAHEAGIVHRDVKPGNIFLTSSGLVKLLDFGIAATGGSGDETHGHGTLRYMSPEQARGEPPDARSDVWSLGLVIHEMLTGEAKGRAESGDIGEPWRRLPASADDGTAAATTEAPALPGWIRAVVARCLSPDVARRYRDGTELLEALERLRPGERARRLRRMAGLAVVAGAAGFALQAMFGGEAPTDSSAVLASRFYEEGLRAYYEADLESAERFFSSALAEDSTFAMAAFYRWRSLFGRGMRSDSAVLAVVEGAGALPERERLVVQATWASIMWDPSAAVLADSLVARYPEEPDGHLLLGQYGTLAGRANEAIPHLRRVIEMDSLSLRGAAPLCRACDAMPGLANAYLQIDSVEAAERTLRDWVRHRPESAEAWSRLAYFLEGMDREAEGLAARREEARLDPGRTMAAIHPARAELRAGRWPEADRLLAERIRNGSPSVQRQALWFLAISLREQGRLEEALEAERTRFERTPPSPEAPPARRSLLEGQLLTEQGRWDEAAEVFVHLADRGRRSWPDGRAARRAIWATAHLATALAAAGDTAALAVVVDSLVVMAPRSPLARDSRLHHYARGLLLSRRGDLRGAERELRRGVSPTPEFEFSRVNLELGRVLLARRRPLEAIETLEAVRRGNLDGSHLYASRTELHEALGRAYEAAGRPKLAVPHYRWVGVAWRDPDPALEPRRDSVLERLVALEGGG